MLSLGLGLWWYKNISGQAAPDTGYILQEDSFLILSEDGAGFLILE